MQINNKKLKTKMAEYYSGNPGRYASSNHNIQTNNPVFIKNLCDAVSLKFKRQLSLDEKNYVIKVIRRIDPNLYINQPKSNIIPIISKVVYDALIETTENKRVNMETPFDSQELIKNLMAGGDGMKTMPNNLVSPFSDINLLKEKNLRVSHNYLYFDSRTRISTEGQFSHLQWIYVDNLTRNNGSVNSYGSLENLIMMRVYPIRIPYLTQADTDLKRITMFIDEFSPQGFVAHEQKRAHFIFETVIDGNWINLESFNYNDGIYRFDDPITNIDKLTISFGVPLDTLIFDADRSSYVPSYGVVTTITTPTNHNLLTGDTVFFADFTTINPVNDSSVIAEINSNKGHLITFVSNTSFTIPINTTIIGAVPPNKIVNVYFGSKRIVIPIEFTFLKTDNVKIK